MALLTFSRRSYEGRPLPSERRLVESVDVRESLKPLLDRLGPREKQLLLLRFFKNMTQAQIAAEIGVSQMHVSRLLTRTLERLKASLEIDG